MLGTLLHKGCMFKVDFFKPIDISIPAKASETSVRAWYQPPMRSTPVRMDQWIGSVAEGGHVNFNDLTINPHAHCTHTESVGHLTSELYSVHHIFKRYFFLANLVTLLPRIKPGNQDLIICGSDLQLDSSVWPAEALVVRTLGNSLAKMHQNYSHTNPPYVDEDFISKLHTQGIEHLLIDLPSIDPESDGRALLRHRQFWNMPQQSASNKTLTELVYIPNSIPDGSYLLELQLAPIENDASPSRPILYKVF